MTNLFLKLINIWNSTRKIFILICSVIILFFFGVYLFSINRMGGDAASHLLLAVSPILKIGAPYKDIWEIKPPVWPLIMYLWSNLFGFKILSIRIINIIVAVLLILIIRPIYKKVFQTPIFELIFLFTIIVVLSPLLYEFMLPTELLGLLLSMGALLALVTFRKDFPKFYFSGLLFFAASQTKEPFTFTVLAIIPIFINSLLQDGFIIFVKKIGYFLLGVLTGFTGIYIYLASLGSVGSYIEVFKYKQTAFPLRIDKLYPNFLPGFWAAERTFTEFSFGLSILLILALLSFYLVNKFKKTLNFNLRRSELSTKPFIVSNPEKIIKYSVFFYALGSFLGFGLGGSFGQHYLIQVVIPFYIIYGFIVSYLFKNASFLFKKPKLYFYMALLIFIFSVVIVIPKRQYLYSYRPKIKSFSIIDDVTGFERRITELTTIHQCVLSVYGWGASENYLYSMRKPCTRFFLVNIVREDWQKKEYARDIMENPPAVIYYRTNAADMDTNKFESEVININKIVKNCYIPDTKEKMLSVPKTKNIENLKNCIKANSV